MPHKTMRPDPDKEGVWIECGKDHKLARTFYTSSDSGLNLLDGDKLLSAIEEEMKSLSIRAKFYRDKDYLMNANDCVNIINKEIERFKRGK